MEPMNATAKWTAERCEVWTPTQNGEAALAATAEAAGLPPAQVRGLQDPPGRRLRPPRRGARLGAPGGADRQGDARHAGQAAVEREEDMLHGRYHPVTQCKLTAGLDAQGNVHGAAHAHLGQSILAGIFPQNIRDGATRWSSRA
jgi:isoquinoline 1-oxidoreductase beta subunit